MTIKHSGAMLLMLLASTSCLRPGRRPNPAAALAPAESPELFAAAVEHLARDARGRLLVDPRPLRPDANLSGVDVEDLLANAEAITRVRAGVLVARGITRTDATDDQRCTFSEGVGLPPGREAMLSDSIRRQGAECRAREPYTTLIFSVPDPVSGNGHPPGTWRIKAVAMTKAGFQVWDLYLRGAAHARWEVIAAERTSSIWS